MIKVKYKNEAGYQIRFVYENDPELEHFPKSLQMFFKGEFLQTDFLPSSNEEAVLFVGLGKEKLTGNLVKEACAKAAKVMKKTNIAEFSVDVSLLVSVLGLEILDAVAEGLIYGLYDSLFYGKKKENSDKKEPFITLFGIEKELLSQAAQYVEKTVNLTKGVLFARNMVNMPGNKLRPKDFADEILKFLEGTCVETELLSFEHLKTLGMTALNAVGESSEYPPCLLILRYMADKDSEEITGLAGKGVTCDTGGYCLKPAGSMMGIKGDMAGGAAVAGAIYALAKNQVKTNVIGLIPMCENRISAGSLLPGDVIGSYSGKTIEICNTDAEGRLILADAVSYAVKKEQVTRVLDIATLTGAVVNMLGFSIAGVITDSQEFFDEFRRAYKKSGEQYWRLPYCKEHEKMIESKIADLKNMGESHCGTITAGLFIRAFAEKRPWMHLDIAGTAWVDTPVFEYQAKGATGAGVTTLYHLFG